MTDSPATIRINGLPVQVVDADQAEQCDWVVCGYATAPSPWTDNVHTTCALCATAIIHRPHAPSRPQKICIACACALELDRKH